MSVLRSSILGGTMNIDFDMDAILEQNKLAQKLIANDPSLGVTAYVIAGDMMSAKRAEKMVDEGMDIRKASVFIGSYARLDFLANYYFKERLDDEWLVKEFPEQWCSADPDDTNPTFLTLWKKLFHLNGNKPAFFGDHNLPSGRLFRIYRGQDVHHDLGIAWTFDKEIAIAFAKGRGL